MLSHKSADASWADVDVLAIYVACPLFPCKFEAYETQFTSCIGGFVDDATFFYHMKGQPVCLTSHFGKVQ